MLESAFTLPSLVEEERKQLLSQRKKAYSLIFLMIMLAQTSYIGAMEGWKYLDQTNASNIGPGCDLIARASGTPIHVDPEIGSNDWNGTWSCPLATLQEAINVSSANDEIILASGLYHENVSISNKDNLLIRAADGATVVFDGTRSIASDMNVSWSTADSDGIQEVTLPQDGWQLFLAYDEQIPARWPNAGFDDETVFNRSYWAEGILTGSNNAYTKGWLTDAGPEAGVHTGLNETINATGLDPVGAIAIMNLGSFRSNSRIITDWNSNNGTFAYDGDGVGWKTKHHAYFLEGKRELIDVDGEWWYNNTNNRLHYKTPSGQDANDLDLRVKVQPFAISVDGSDGVTIQGIDFFGTTVNFNNCDGCSFTNATLEYPSTSKRGLGIAGESEDDRWMTRFYRSTNSFVDNISITNTDGGAIEFHGSGGQSHNNTINNSYFHAIDWSAADQKGLMTTIYEGGRDMYFTNNSVHLTGASSVLSIGDAPKVFYNEVWDVGYLQTDGAVVQVMQGEAPGAEIAYNWIHDVIKYGARFDAPIGQAGEGRNGTMHHNVIWNAAGGLMVKGDYHNINNNTVFNSSGKNDMIILTDNGVNNGNSTIHRNAADKMADHRSDSWSLYPLPAGTYWNNWNGYVNTTDSVWNQLVDPANRDFRPKVNSHLDNMSAGAYDAGVANPWTAGVSWSYSPMSNPISGCMDSIAINYNSNAVFSDGSCIYTTLSSSSSTLSLEVGVTMTPYTLTYTTPFLADDKQTAASSGSVGAGTNIALDSNGAVHICSKTVTTDNLYYSTNASGSWQSATLDSSGNVGSDCFIILDSDDDIHITYRDDSNTNLKYATKALSDGIAASNWAVSTMDNNGDVGNFGSMVVDANDTLHVAYYSANGASLKYATLADGSTTWSREVVESTNDVGKYTSIALDSNGNPHITYFDDTNNDLRYTHKIGSSWTFTTLDSTAHTGKGTSLAIDSNDHLHVAYKTNSTEIAYMTNRSGSWVKTTLDANSTGTWGVNYINIMLDGGDDPHVVYSDMVDYDVFYMSNTRGMWERILVAGDSISKSSEAAMDENDGIHVAYYIDGSFDDIGYAAVRSLTHRPLFEIEPDLPNGVLLGAENGTIYGTPSILQTTKVTYTVWANNSGGSASTQVNITINDVAPSISYSNNDITGTKNVAISPSIGPTTSGGTITSWEISPSPGSAFTFNSANGEISGTPSIVLSRTQYTIWANNSGGSSVAYVNVTINDVAPNTIVYSSHDLVLEKGTAMTTTTPAISGGSVTSWEISPSIPNGLSFSSTTGAISGTPSSLQTTAVGYTIWANNSGGSTSTQMNITINDQIASVSYPSTVEVSNDRNMTTVTPTNTGGAVTSWVIVPSLPSGLNFGSSNGSIWGTPTGLLANATYTVYANNSGGSTSITFTLGLNWTLTPSAEGAYIIRNSSIASDITWEWDYDPLEAQNLSLATGEWNTCAIGDDGLVYCWGRNGNGQIGNGQTSSNTCGNSGHKCKDVPTATSLIGSSGDDIVSIAFGHQHACALLDTGDVECWGRNNAGQLGQSGGDEDKPQPVNLGTGRTATSIYAGGHYSCAILDDESVKCWGQNTDGQLGIGSTSNANTPTTINTLGSGRTAVTLATAFSAVCALLDDGSVKCWGDDSRGQLGNAGSNTDLNSPPSSTINLGSGRTAKAITGGEYHFCAILDDDSIKCWGDGNYGKLGTGYSYGRSTPSATSGGFASGRYAVAIDAGYDHTCVILDNGDLTCWGDDSKGQLGNAGITGTWSSLQSTTVNLGTGRTAISLSAGGTHTCAQLDNDQLKCWGNRADGQVGDNGGFNNPLDRTSPSAVSSNTNGGNTYADTGVFPSAAVSGATCTISPSLPTGLSLTAGTCTITGTPTATATNATYTIWANVSGQSFSGQVWLEVGLNAPDISYSSSTYTYTKDSTISTLNPINAGGEVTTWAINATLPSGLSFGTSNGSIWGTPTLEQIKTSYTVWANNTAGSSSTTINITINDEAPVISYSTTEITGTKDVAISPHVGPTTSGGTITSWEISPDPGSAFHFNSNNGYISGTPSILLSRTQYTIWANNSGGSSVAYVNVTINDQLPTLSYTPDNLTLTKGQASSDLPLNATLTGSGTITSWAINATLPAGLNFGTSNGTIWGIPSVLQTTATTYTIWANNTGGSSSATITLTINDEAPGPFEYIPENNTWTNNSYVNIGPSFINITTGNNSNWLGSQVRSGSINIGRYVEFVVDDVIYFDESYGGGHLYAYNTSNNTAWRVFETMESQTVYDVGETMSMIAGDIIYFSGDIWSGGSEKTHLYAHNTSNGTTWRVPNTSTYYQGVNLGTEGVVLDDKIYFAANTGGGNLQVWGYNSVNNTAWQATSTSHGFGCCSNLQIVGDTIYYTANRELWAYNTSNQSDWEVAEINPHYQFTSDPGRHMSLLVGDTMYFDADDGSTGRELWAYNTSNETYWRVVDISNGPGASNPGSTANILVGDTIYFNAYDSNTGYTEMWAHTTSNVTTWKATDLNSQTGYGNPSIGVGLIGDPVVIGDTIFFDAIALDSSSVYKKELWAHDTSNHSTWQVSNLSGASSSNQIGSYVFLGLGDTLYFSNTHSPNFWLWAYDTTNQSVWNTSIRPGDSLSVVVGNTIYLEGSLPISNSFRLIAHQPGSVNHQTNTGGNVTTWTINGSLPSGVTFNIQTGVLSGTPTELWPQTSYMVWANNSGGSSTAYLNITVVDELPTIAYSPTDITLTNNTASTDLPLVPTLTGAGEITSWAINASLPAGLTFETSNGTIWGTPNELWNTTAYTVWANNSGGSSVAYLNITVNDQLPTSVTYTPENLTLTRGEISSDLPLVPSLTGPGDITIWGINASLPTGLSFGTNNGTIWGVPQVNMSTTAYTVWANNSGGSVSTTLNITVLEPIVVLDYNPENLTLVRGIAMTDLHPIVTGGSVETWEIHPSIPAGLNFADGVLSGTPTVNMTLAMFTIYANTTGGSTTHTINITILEPTVTLDYNPENLTLVRGIAMTTLHPTITGGSVETWGIHESIPAGLNFADGVLSGTPTVNLTLTTFTIYANTTGGSATHTINLTILEPGVILYYNPENQTLTRGVAMVTMTPTVTNGTAETWSIDPLLPSGLNFNNGVIGGTPTVNMTRATFTVWANTSGGAAFHTINLTIHEPVVTLDYNPENQTLTRGVPMTPMHPIITGGNVSDWYISPSPPSGFNFANGVFSGTPVFNQTTTIMFTIFANTSGGSTSHTINITVLEPLVELAYNPENQTFIRTEQTIAWSPTVSGGNPETWAIEPALPNGLVFDNGTITGSPTVNLTTTQYTVWANNSGGSASTSINITINEPAPDIEYVPSDLVLTRGTAMTTLQPNVTGGLIETWEIEPAIPNGLSFVDGVISGTPTAIQNQTQYVVWANNSGGSLMAYLNITTLDIVPEIAYTPENMTLTNDTSVVDWLPVNIGGPALTWSISPALSEGLEFNETTGHITGTPTEVMNVRTYVVTATNSGGSASTQINITVLDQVPMVAYVPDDVVLLNNSTVLTMEAISTGGIVTSWSILPDPSPGLLFDTTNGTLSGVATQVQNRTMYTITASNDVGSITVFVNITVEDLFYNMSLGPLYLLNNSEMVALEPESIISESTFEIEPDLPEGLFLGADNGTIWGTPTELMDLTNFTIYANSSLFNDEFVVQIGVLEDTDLDGLPNQLPEDADPRRGLIEDLDDDGDGYTDLIEGDCLSNPLDGSDVPSDLDGDFVCNAIDDDIDGDGLNNSVETNTSAYIDANNTGTDAWNADTDGDGICDGPIAPALPVDYCEAGPDAFPNDAAAYLDTDGDGMPDELWGESTTGLTEDMDDDNDGWTDQDEADCGPTDSKDEFDTPVDSDGDTICDFNEVLSVTYGTGDFELLQGQRNVSLQPLITGMTVDIWEISPALPYGLFFGGDTMARTSNGNGTVYGVPFVPSNLTEYTVTATNLLTGTQISTTFNLSVEEDYDLDGLPNNNTRMGLLEVDMDDDGDGFNDTFEMECGGDPYNRSSVPKIEADGTCYNYRSYEEPPEKDKNPFKPICFPIIFLVLAFILVVPMILTRRKERVGVQAEHVSATPEFQSGTGTALDPFVLRAVTIPYNTKAKTEERIRCAEMSPGYEVKVRETNVEINKRRYGATQFGGVQDGTGVLKSNSDGLLMIQFTFDGTIEPSKFGMTYKSELILDEKTYFVWHVETGAKKGK